MKPLFDLRVLDTPMSTRGIGMFAKNFVAAVAKELSGQIYSINNSDFKDPALMGINSITYDSENHLHTIKLFYFLLTNRFNFYHSLSPHYFINLPFYKKFVTIHDVMQLRLCEDSRVREDYYNLYQNAIKADAIFADSYNTKKDIIEFLKVEDEKIHVIYGGVPEGYFEYNNKPLEEALCLKKYNLKKNEYYFYVGGFAKHKNLNFLLDVFYEVNKLYPFLKLVLAGNLYETKEITYLQSRIEKLFIKDKVIFTDFIIEEEKKILFSNSLAFLFPSLYEGFGLPVVEAMALKTPVLCSNRASLKEIVENKKYLLDPLNKEVWIKHMVDLMNLSEEKITSLKEEFYKNSLSFKWKYLAKKVLDVYQSVCCKN